jgi:hypothetical protein
MKLELSFANAHSGLLPTVCAIRRCQPDFQIALQSAGALVEEGLGHLDVVGHFNKRVSQQYFTK